MWTKLDQYKFDNGNFSKPDDNFGCDGRNCGNTNELHIPFYHYSYGDDYSSIDLCPNCVNDIDQIFCVTEVDRIEYSVEEKPLIWPCFICDKNLGGGFAWFLYEHNYIKIDVCKECNENCSFYGKLKGKLVLVTDNIISCNRTSANILLDISYVEERKIPDELLDIITQEKIDDWTDLLSAIAHLEPNFKEFGPVKQWTLFTDLYDIPHCGGAMTGLLVDCSVNTNGRVASLVSDNHGRIGIDIIYSSFDDYKQAFNDWSNNRLKGEELQEKIKELEEDDEDDDVEDDDIKLICTEFSGYIRLHLNKDTYYG